MATPDTLVLHYRVAPSYYLYRERFALAPADGQAQWLDEAVYPAGETKHDPVFDKDMEVYHHDLDIRVPLKPGAAGPWTLTVTNQGCAEAGLCYPPMDHVLTLAPTVGGYTLAGVDLPQGAAISAAPLLARMSTWVPPAKSMPKFMPTNRNMRTETIERNADSG